MTQPNYGHYGPSTGPVLPSQPPQPKKSRKGLWISLGVVGVVALGCLGTFGAILSAADDATKTPGDKSISTTSAPIAAPAKTSSAPAAPAKPKPADPKPADFKLTVKTLEKQCFGSAGCLVTYRISDVTYSGPGLDEDKSYEITYKVTGLKDPKIGTFTLNGDGSYSVDEQENGDTSSSSKVLKAVVTSVEAV